MRRIWAAAFWGSLVGLLTTATLLLAMLLVVLNRHGVPINGGVAARILLRTLLIAGPGALLLGLVLSSILLRGHERGRPRATTLALGALLGLPLGLIDLVATLGLFGSTGELENLWRYPTEGLIFLSAALGGGAFFGLACAWGISRPERKAP